MSNTHKGEILEIRETKQITDKFVKRQFVVDQSFTGQYGTSHNPVVFSLIQEKCGLVDQFKVGDNVIVSFDLDSRPWIKDGVHQRDKDGELAYFLDVRAWKIELDAAQNSEPQGGTVTSAPTTADPSPMSESDESMPPNKNFDNPTQVDDQGPDDLPF